MMALIYAVQGAFWPLLGIHLQDQGIGGRLRGWIYATYAIGSFAVPLGAGQLVDRWMATQHALAIGYAIGGCLLLVVASGLVTGGSGLFLTFLAFFSLISPMYALSNSLTMRHLDDPRRDFGRIRLWGTIGWMGVGWLVSMCMLGTGSTRPGQGTYEAFWVAAACAIVLSAWCLTLPHTPPLAVEQERRGLAEGLELVRKPDVAAFLITAFGVSLTTPVIFQIMPSYLESRGLSRAWVASVMTLGQWLELVGLAILPWLFNRIGYKGTLLVGIGALFLRFFSLSLHPPLWLAVAGTHLHGLSSACFVIGGQVYIDSQAPGHRRASAQALLAVLTTGLGSLIGAIMAGELATLSRHGVELVFLVPCIIDGALIVYLLMFFRTHRSTIDASRTVTSPELARGHSRHVLNLVGEPADARRALNLVGEPAEG
jgi:MFS family permease